MIGLLDFFADWQPSERLFANARLSTPAVRAMLAELVRAGFLQRSDRSIHPKDKALESWESWNPSAGLFHEESRNCDFEAGEREVGVFLRDRLANHPQPDRTKNYHGRRSIHLPPAEQDGTFARVLLERRTWRTFGPRRLRARDLATLLGLTFGVQKWLDQGALGRAMLRTSPSGGARHPIEAYVAVRRVSRIPSGLYYYAPVDHRLVLLQSRTGAARLKEYLPGQPFYASASAVVFITAVFPRTQWQYTFPRAYRVVLLEAGHFCQTFCLVATALGLAPFCTAALADSVIENDLGIDGITESVLYACGAGTRP
jgi:SagB-type dehydrogenase family enzyme